MTYDVIRHSASSSLKPRLKFWKYNPNTKTAYFTATTKDGERQYPIGLSKLQDMTPGSIKNALTSSLIRFGVTHDDQLIKAVNEILSMSHSATEEEEMDVIDVSEEVLEHSNRKSDNQLYKFDRVWKDSEGNWRVDLKNPITGAISTRIGINPNWNGKPISFTAMKSTVKNALDSHGLNVSDSEIDKIVYTFMRLAPHFFTETGASTYQVQAGKPKTKRTLPRQHLKESSVSHALFTEVFDEESLEHHGILGMKWGVRRFQNKDGSLTVAGAKRYGVNGDRKGTQNRLNDLDKAIARNKRHANELAEDEKYLEKKANKFANSNSSNADAKKDEYERKLGEVRAKKAEYEKNIETGKKEIESLLKEAVDNGYTVSRVDTMRSTAEGRDLISSMLATGVGMAIPALLGMPFGIISVPAAAEKGTKYKVKETKEGEEAKVVDKKSSYLTTGVPRSISQATNDGLKEREQRQQRQQQQNRGMIAMVPAGTLPQETRLSKEEEAAFWKELAKYYKEQGNVK